MDKEQNLKKIRSKLSEIRYQLKEIESLLEDVLDSESNIFQDLDLRIPKNQPVTIARDLVIDGKKLEGQVVVIKEKESYIPLISLDDEEII